jgi:outer membrane protein assembly factor BamB
VADENCVIVTSLNSKAPYITALNAETGTRLWTAKLPKWPGIHGQHRTPLIANLNNTKVLLNWSKRSRILTELTALELDSGRELWSFQPEGKFAGEAVAGIIQKENTLYLPSKADFAAIDISALATGGAPREIWQTSLRNKGPVTSSPLLHKGLIFMVSDRGYASCLNAGSGELLWQEKLPRGYYSASPIVMGQNVYFCNTSGLTTIIACESTFKQVAQNKLPDAIYATPAPVDGHLYIRTTVGLWCIQ